LTEYPGVVGRARHRPGFSHIQVREDGMILENQSYLPLLYWPPCYILPVHSIVPESGRISPAMVSSNKDFPAPEEPSRIK